MTHKSPQPRIMLTRSKARALIGEKTTVLVSPSATGQGTHVRWCYPKGHVYVPPATASEPESDDSDSSSSGSLTSFSSFSFSSSSSSSSSTSPDSSFYAVPPQPQTPTKTQHDVPVTPSRRTPKKLQRSPVQRWVETDGSTRMVLVPDSFTEEDVAMRESIVEIRLAQVAERELALMRKQRDLAFQIHLGYEFADEGEGLDMDSRKEGFPMDVKLYEGLNGQIANPSPATDALVFIREDTEPLEDINVIPLTGQPQRPQLLGPHGTELIDSEMFTPRASHVHVYPDEWKKALVGQRTEIFAE